MNAAQAKRVPLQDLLAGLGVYPERHNTAKGELWYLSPFREETTPSFKIHEGKNVWYDFGLAAGGNVIDFAMLYFRVDVAQALHEIASVAGGMAPASNPAVLAARPLDPPAPKAGAILRPLTNRSLLAYLSRRGIPAEVARPYLQEIHYRHNNKPYFALAFPNASGGYELRNPYFKGTWAPKDISQVAGADPATVAIFEGFMDFLSALACRVLADPHPSIIVVNSASLRARALAAIQAEAHTVELYFDHDDTGRALTGYFREELPELVVVDRSNQYSGHKDLNVWAVAQEPAVRLSPPVER